MTDPYNRTKPPPAAAGSETAYLQDPANAPFKPAAKPAVTQQPNPTRPATGIAEAPLQPPAAPMVSVGPEIAVAPAGTLASEYGPPAGLFDFGAPQGVFSTAKKPQDDGGGTITTVSTPESRAKERKEARIQGAVDFALENLPAPDYGPAPEPEAPRRSKRSSLLSFPELLR